MEQLKAKFDRLIKATRTDDDGKVISVRETYHFTIGKMGDPISGGFYIKKGTPIPESLEIIVPDVEERT